MKKATEVKRIFRMKDEIMLVNGNSFYTFFLENESKFTDKYNDLKYPFAANMKAHLDFCEDEPRDNSKKSDQVYSTSIVEEAMEKGRSVFQIVYGYLILDDSNDTTVRTNFGQPEYDKSRRSHIKLPVLLEQAYLVANEPILKQKLINKGAKESDILALHTIGEDIFEKTQGLKSTKGGRKTTKKERIEGLNLVWMDMQLLSNCAKTVFMNNYAMYSIFLLYPKDKNKDKGKDK